MAREADINIARLSLIREMQHLMALLIFRTGDGRVLSFSSLSHFMQQLREMARYCEQQSLTLKSLLCNSKCLEDYSYTIESSPLLVFNQWLMRLSSLDSIDVGFIVAEPRNASALAKRVTDYLGESRQTPPIPTRIYSQIITNLSVQLDDAEVALARFEALMKAVKEAYVQHASKAPGEKFQLQFESLVEEHGLVEYFFDKARASGVATHKVLSGLLADIQVICKLAIHTFSGMRDLEALYLPYHCGEIVHDVLGRKSYVIVGITTKLHGSRAKRTRWVTNSEGHRAIKIAQRIADMLYGFLGVTSKNAAVELNNTPLFVSTSYFPLSGMLTTPANGVFHPSLNRLAISTAGDYFQEKLRPIIEENDLVELEDIDPNRNWRNEAEFQIGQPWPLRTHQFRRSLALYAQRSGLVTLSSLRRQLQHITKAMSLSYARGSNFARNFIDDDLLKGEKHFASEWREAKSESECIAFIRDLILSDEPLFGPSGTFIQQAKNRGDVMPRDETMRRFKKGLMAYKPNPLGGCTNPEECDNEKKGLSILDSPCLEGPCKHLVGKKSKVIRVIPYQQSLVDSLDPSSVTYAMERRELDALVKAVDSWQDNSKEASHA